MSCLSPTSSSGTAQPVATRRIESEKLRSHSGLQCLSRCTAGSTNVDGKMRVAVGGEKALAIVETQPVPGSDLPTLHVSRHLGSMSKRSQLVLVTDVKWHPMKENTIATSSASGLVVVWDVTKGSHYLLKRDNEGGQKTEHTRLVKRVCWHPSQEAQLLSASEDSTVKLWDLRMYKQNAPLTFRPCLSNAMQMRDVEFDPFDHNSFLCGTDESAELLYWDIRMHDRGPKRRIQASTESSGKGAINSLNFHPTRRGLLVTGSKDRSLRVWDIHPSVDDSHVKPEKVIQTLASVGRVQWRPTLNGTSHQIAEVSMSPMCVDLNIWDESSAQLPLCCIRKPHGEVITDLEWCDPNGEFILSTSKNGTFAMSQVKHAYVHSAHLCATAVAWAPDESVTFFNDVVHFPESGRVRGDLTVVPSPTAGKRRSSTLLSPNFPSQTVGSAFDPRRAATPTPAGGGGGGGRRAAPTPPPPQQQQTSPPPPPPQTTSKKETSSSGGFFGFLRRSKPKEDAGSRRLQGAAGSYAAATEARSTGDLDALAAAADSSYADLGRGSLPSLGSRPGSAHEERERSHSLLLGASASGVGGGPPGRHPRQAFSSAPAFSELEGQGTFYGVTLGTEASDFRFLATRYMFLGQDPFQQPSSASGGGAGSATATATAAAATQQQVFMQRKDSGIDAATRLRSLRARQQHTPAFMCRHNAAVVEQLRTMRLAECRGSTGSDADAAAAAEAANSQYLQLKSVWQVLQALCESFGDPASASTTTSSSSSSSSATAAAAAARAAGEAAGDASPPPPPPAAAPPADDAGQPAAAAAEASPSSSSSSRRARVAKTDAAAAAAVAADAAAAAAAADSDGGAAEDGTAEAPAAAAAAAAPVGLVVPLSGLGRKPAVLEESSAQLLYGDGDEGSVGGFSSEDSMLSDDPDGLSVAWGDDEAGGWEGAADADADASPAARGGGDGGGGGAVDASGVFVALIDALLDMGDVQTAATATLCVRALPELFSPTEHARRGAEWIVAYHDLLLSSDFCSTAACLMKYCPFPGVSAFSAGGTSVDVKCRGCSEVQPPQTLDLRHEVCRQSRFCSIWLLCVRNPSPPPLPLPLSCVERWTCLLSALSVSPSNTPSDKRHLHPIFCPLFSPPQDMNTQQRESQCCLQARKCCVCQGAVNGLYVWSRSCHHGGHLKCLVCRMSLFVCVCTKTLSPPPHLEPHRENGLDRTPSGTVLRQTADRSSYSANKSEADVGQCIFFLWQASQKEAMVKRRGGGVGGWCGREGGREGG